MMHRWFSLCLFMVAFLLVAVGTVQGEEIDFAEAITVEHRIDWLRSQFILEATLSRQGPLTLKTRYRAERYITDNLPVFFVEHVGNFCLDSYRLIGDYFDENGDYLERLKELALEGKKESASYSSDMKSIQVTYSFPLFGETGLISLFVSHTRPFPARKAFGFVPTKQYTGVVIYAKGEYPLFGKSDREKVRPSLFPKIFDEQMRIVIEKERCDPESLKRWGMAVYSESLDFKPFSPRVGSFPIHIMARGIFGKNNTDIIIPTESARQLLALKGNRDLLIHGRILVIVDSP
jgi:hypothetical protein